MSGVVCVCVCVCVRACVCVCVWGGVVHHKYHMDWPGIEHRPAQWEAGN
jgi:hypothetical protein